jgi:hypothetical protein
MEMGMHKTYKQMGNGKVDPRCQYKFVTPEKWLLKKLN